MKNLTIILTTILFSPFLLAGFLWEGIVLFFTVGQELQLRAHATILPKKEM